MATDNRNAVTASDLDKLCNAIDGLQTRATEKSKQSTSKTEVIVSEQDTSAESTEPRPEPHPGPRPEPRPEPRPGPRPLQQNPIRTTKFFSDDYIFNCLACNQFAFMSAHMYHVSRGNTTAVADVGMYSRCKSWLMNNCILPWNVEVFEQNPWDETVIANEDYWRARKQFCCSCCGKHWGVLGERNDSIVPFMKLTSFRVRDPEGRIRTYERYKELPLRFQRLNERAYRDHTYDLHYKDCMDMKGTMTSSGGILRTEFAQLFVPPGAVIGVKCHIKCDTLAFSSYLDDLVVDDDEQVIAPSFVADPIRVTDDRQIGKNKYRFMHDFVKHVCIRLTHMAHEPKNIKVCVNTARDEWKYRGVRRVDLSNEIIADLQNIQDGIADDFSNVPAEAIKPFQDIPGFRPHPNTIVQHRPKNEMETCKIDEAASEYLQKDAVAKFMYEITIIMKYEYYLNKDGRSPSETAEQTKDGCSNERIDEEHCEEQGEGKGEDNSVHRLRKQDIINGERKDLGKSVIDCVEELKKSGKTMKSNYNNAVDRDDDDDDDGDDDDDYFCVDDKYVYIFTRHLAGCYTCTEAHRMTPTPTQITVLVYASIYQGYVDVVVYVYDPQEVHPQYLKALARYQHDHFRSLLLTHSITYKNNLDMDDMLEIDINNRRELQQNVHTIDLFNESIAQCDTVSELFSIQQRREHPGSCIAFPQVLGSYQFQVISQQVKNLKVEFRVTHKTTNVNSKETDAAKFTDMNTASYDDILMNFDLSPGDTEEYDPFEDMKIHDSNKKPEMSKGFL